MITGGITMDALDWIGPDQLSVSFSSEHTDKLHQCYVGRLLAGETASVDQAVLVIPLTPAKWPEWIWVVAIETDEIGEDHGDWLPPRPYNRVQVAFDKTGWSGDTFETDCNRFELSRGTTPGGSVDYGRVVDRVLFETGLDAYSLMSDPLPGSGTWNLGIRGIDALGNEGTPAETSAEVLAVPPDFLSTPGINVVLGTATITCELPTR